MASKLGFVQYVSEQLAGAGVITYRKMFGEYGLYCDGKIFALICDDQLFIKITEAGKKLWPDLETKPPYEGAKPYFLIEDVDDRNRLCEIAAKTCQELPVPKPKKGKEKTLGQKKEGKLDYKKEYKDLYLPKQKPDFVEVPDMLFLMVDGKGDPNTSQSYKDALGILYGLSYGIKMSKMSGTQPEGYFEYVVPPLEGLWWSETELFSEGNKINKEKFFWTSMIRQPEFVTNEVFEAAKETLKKKNPSLDTCRARLVHWQEGLCCQVMHVGPYDMEPDTIRRLEQFIAEAGFEPDFSGARRHHEIYLGDPRKTAPEKLRTVIRYPVKRKNE